MILILLILVGSLEPVTVHGTTTVPTKSLGLNAENSIPPSRSLASIVYDEVNDRVMMYGGQGDEVYGDTWVFDYPSGSWIELSILSSPSVRHSATMVYDSSHEVIILFGGYGESSALSETWIFDCATEEWTEVTPEYSPPPRMSHAMVYDSKNDRVLLFSGYGVENDTWAYNYATNTWTEMHPTIVPHKRYGAGCVFDTVTNSMIIFGGNSHGYRSDCWKYDYALNTWTEIESNIHPPALKWSCVTYDTINQKMLLFGGDMTSGIVSNTTWIFDAATDVWTEQSPVTAPSQRMAAPLVYDSFNENALLFGGNPSPSIYLNDTWLYDFVTHDWTNLSTGLSDSDSFPIGILLLVSAVGLVIVGGVIIRRR